MSKSLLVASTLLLLLHFPSLITAHFSLEYPVPRTANNDDDGSNMPNYPCGGANTPSTIRTPWPISGGPIQLNMGHTETRVQVVLALGDNPAEDDFNIILVPTLLQQGPREFCLGDVEIRQRNEDRPAINVEAGMNGTIQVITNGDPEGGLYACADVTFVNEELSQEEYQVNCQNSTGVTVIDEAVGGDANASSEATATGTPSESDDTSAANHALIATGWVLISSGLVLGFGLFAVL